MVIPSAEQIDQVIEILISKLRQIANTGSGKSPELIDQYVELITAFMGAKIAPTRTLVLEVCTNPRWFTSELVITESVAWLVRPLGEVETLWNTHPNLMAFVEETVRRKLAQLESS